MTAVDISCDTRCVKVCIPNTARTHYDYAYTLGATLPYIGARVMVPFRNKILLGFVVDHGFVEKKSVQLKSIQAVLDAEPLLSLEILSLCRWVAQYYQAPLSEVLPWVLPKSYRSGFLQSKCTDSEENIEENIEEKNSTREKYCNTVHPMPYALNSEQQAAVLSIKPWLNQYRCFLLYGITGSGKTEVYLQVIQEVLAQQKQVLVLVPEIGLTPQWLARFTERFSYSMAVIHSELSESERQRAWWLAHQGRIKLVIGTRAAIFTSLPNLGLIVIDEEHDASFKQMEGPRYSARDVAIVRARAKNIPVILGSATPSLESLYNASIKKYDVLYLKERAASRNALHYQLIDLRQQSMQHGLSQPALQLIKSHLEQKNQVLVFINRRGYSPVLFCHHCGWMAACKDCDTHLTYHSTTNQIKCHHCGYMAAKPKKCHQCHGTVLLPVGVGTQRVYEYLSEIFPDTSIARIDRDETKRKKALEKQLTKILSGEVQLIVGTQMLAKGHHFPNLTLVVILDTDQGFYNADFRALERLGQLLTQVAGRAGRANDAGQVAIQTYLPHHPLLNYLIQSGYSAFSEAILADRSLAQLPPFSFMALISAQSKQSSKAMQLLESIKQYLLKSGVKLLGPSAAPMARKAMFYRYQILVQSTDRKKLQKIMTELRNFYDRHKLTIGVRWGIDVDPLDLS